MSANQVIKSFTAVMVLLVGVLVGERGWAADDSKATSKSGRKAAERAQCLVICPMPENSSQCNDYTGAKAKSCEAGIQKQCFRECISELNKEVETCATAVKEYNTAQVKSSSACKAFDKDLSGTCSEKVAACGQKINGTFAPADEDDEKSGAEMVKSLIMQKITSSMNPAAAGAGSGACIRQFDAKAVRDAEKEMRKEKKDLEKEIKKEADEQLKLAAEQRTKSNEISKKIAEIEKDLKKDGSKKDSEMRKQILDAAKVTLDSDKKFRTLNLSITSENNRLAQLRFAQQTAMLALTHEKVAFACKQQLLALKNGILNSGAIDPKAAESANLKALSDQIKNQGTKGTGNLKALLAQAQKQCFEAESTKKNQKILDFNQRFADHNNNIKEFKSQIEEEKKQLALSQDNVKKIQEESAKEKSEEEKAALKEIANFNKELADNETSILEKINLSRAQTTKLNMDIQNLALKTTTETEMAFTEAQEAIGTASGSRLSASVACDCSDPTANKNICSQLRIDGEAVSKTSSSAKGGSAK